LLKSIVSAKSQVCLPTGNSLWIFSLYFLNWAFYNPSINKYIQYTSQVVAGINYKIEMQVSDMLNKTIGICAVVYQGFPWMNPLYTLTSVNITWLKEL
jgi:hypothetical protein